MLNTVRGGVSLAEIGRRIKAARVDAGFDSQEALGEAAGVSQATISRVEQGEPVSTLVLHRIATVTGKRLDYFLSPIGHQVAVQLRAPQGAPEAVASAVEFAVQLLRDYRFLRELSDGSS
jgi:transcriptional regulator with XRE-family HTH domain